MFAATTVVTGWFCYEVVRSMVDVVPEISTRTSETMKTWIRKKFDERCESIPPQVLQ